MSHSTTPTPDVASVKRSGVSVRIDAELLEHVRHEAFYLRSSITSCVSIALREWLERCEPRRPTDRGIARPAEEAASGVSLACAKGSGSAAAMACPAPRGEGS